MAARLVALKQYFEMQTLKTRPLKHASLRHVADSRALREADILARESLLGSEVGSTAESLPGYQTFEGSPHPAIRRRASDSVNKVSTSPSADGGPSQRWSWDSYASDSFFAEKVPGDDSAQAAMEISGVSSHKDSSSDDTGIAMGTKKGRERKRSFRKTKNGDGASSQTLSGTGGLTSGEEDGPHRKLKSFDVYDTGSDPVGHFSKIHVVIRFTS